MLHQFKVIVNQKQHIIFSEESNEVITPTVCIKKK